MRIAARFAGVLVVGALLTTGCGGGQPTTASDMPPEVLQALKPLDTPYQIIYNPPVYLGKDRQPGS